MELAEHLQLAVRNSGVFTAERAVMEAISLLMRCEEPGKNTNAWTALIWVDLKSIMDEIV